MGVFHVFWMVQMVTNRAMHHITIYLEWNTVVYIHGSGMMIKRKTRENKTWRSFRRKSRVLCGLRRLTTLGDNSCYDKFGDNDSKIPGKGTNEKLGKIYKQIMYQRTEVCRRGTSEKRKTFADSIWTLCDGVAELYINTKLNVCQ